METSSDPEEMVVTFHLHAAPAARVVRVEGVQMNCGMDWLYQQAARGSRKVEKIMDIFTPGHVSIPRSIHSTDLFLSSSGLVSSTLFVSVHQKHHPPQHQCRQKYKHV
jgi:hypothetical protein